MLDDGIGEGVVVQAERAGIHTGLGLANLDGGSKINAPVEAENTALIVGLEALVLGCRCQNGRLGQSTRKEDQQRDRPICRAQHGPIGGAGALQTGVNHILWMVRRVGLGNQAVAADEEINDTLGGFA